MRKFTAESGFKKLNINSDKMKILMKSQ